MKSIEPEDRLYPHRPAHDVQSVYSDFSERPKYPLREEERTQAIAFDKLLSRGKQLSVENGKLISHDQDTDHQSESQSLEDIVQIAINSHNIYFDYFLTDEGKRRLLDFFPYTFVDFYTREDLQTFFKNIKKRDIDHDREGFLRLVASAREYTEDTLQKAFNENGAIAESDVQLERFTIIEDPSKLLDVISFYRRRKSLLRSISKEGLNRGELYFLQLHKARINMLLVDRYSELLALVDQIYGSTAPEKTQIIDEIRKLMSGTTDPEGKPLDSNKITARTAQMDKRKWGSSEEHNPQNPGYYSVIDKETHDLLEVHTQTTSAVDESDSIEPLLSPEQKRRIPSAERMKSWFEKALEGYGILSQYPHEANDFGRSGPAPDKKWQVVIDPKATSLSVSPRKQTINIPPKFASPLSRAVCLLDHEMAHVMQVHLAKTLGIPILDTIQTGRTSSLHEAGAIQWEREAAREYNNESRPVGFAYMKAIECREKGGSFGDCVKAYYDERVRTNPSANPKSYVKMAVKGVMRIFRNNGDLANVSSHVYNSKPLSYVEQEQFRLSAENAGMLHMLLVGSAHPLELLEMYNLGLIDINSIPFPNQRPSQMLRDTILAFAQSDAPVQRSEKPQEI